MRRLVLGLVILVALSVCCLIPGTPVNNDPSDAARNAGIHLTSQVPPRASVAAPASFLAAFTIALAFITVRRRGVDVRPHRRVAVLRSVDLIDVGRRRGPPALAI